jgi:ectoine hydroxylase-related dioxygenase (phytanoyl-CoA dioxygenase family)
MTRVIEDSYVMELGVVSNEVITNAMRLLHLEIVNWGLTKEQIDEWHNNKCWFPTLRYHPAILALIDAVPNEYKVGQMCEPQILFHFPDTADEWDFEMHQDKEPEWANGRKYTSIVGVALTPNNEENGGLVVRTVDEGEFGEDFPTEPMEPGDIIVFDPLLWHRGGLNRTGQIRAMVYFRFLEEENVSN